jgi:hypothetical protein
MMERRGEFYSALKTQRIELLQILETLALSRFASIALLYIMRSKLTYGGTIVFGWLSLSDDSSRIDACVSG